MRINTLLIGLLITALAVMILSSGCIFERQTLTDLEKKIDTAKEEVTKAKTALEKATQDAANAVDEKLKKVEAEAKKYLENKEKAYKDAIEKYNKKAKEEKRAEYIIK